MSTRRIVGIVISLTGIIISVGHLVLAIFSRTAERDHSHEGIVFAGLALTLVGLLMLADDKRRD